MKFTKVLKVNINNCIYVYTVYYGLTSKTKLTTKTYGAFHFGLENAFYILIKDLQRWIF